MIRVNLDGSCTVNCVCGYFIFLTENNILSCPNCASMLPIKELCIDSDHYKLTGCNNIDCYKYQKKDVLLSTEVIPSES